MIINPEFYTVWNYRRDIIIEYFQKALSIEEITKLFEKELLFTLQKMKEYPKVYWLWNHRVWLLNNHPTKANWDFELNIIEKLLSSDSRNFHGWHYRRFIINKIEIEKGESLALQEFEYTTSKINKDFSNFSAWHNRSKLIPILFNLKIFNDKLEFFKNELNILQNAMYTDPEDQSFWVYLRWLLSSEIFINDIELENFLNILNDQLNFIKELNQLEKDDNGIDNTWCLKTIVFIENLIKRLSEVNKFDSEIKDSLKILETIDPLRKNLYKHYNNNI